METKQASMGVGDVTLFVRRSHCCKGKRQDLTRQFYRSFGDSPVCFETRANILGPLRRHHGRRKQNQASHYEQVFCANRIVV